MSPKSLTVNFFFIEISGTDFVPFKNGERVEMIVPIEAPKPKVN